MPSEIPGVREASTLSHFARSLQTPASFSLLLSCSYTLPTGLLSLSFFPLRQLILPTFPYKPSCSRIYILKLARERKAAFRKEKSLMVSIMWMTLYHALHITKSF